MQNLRRRSAVALAARTAALVPSPKLRHLAKAPQMMATVLLILTDHPHTLYRASFTPSKKLPVTRR
jgi:hypothetical protein